MNKWETKTGYEIFQVRTGRSNSFVVSNRESFVLVDTGREKHWSSLSKTIDEIGLSKGTFTALILTHTHFDHAENASSLKHKYNIPIMVHKSEEEYLAVGDSPLPQGAMLITKLFIDLFGNLVQPWVKYQPANHVISIDDRYDLNTIGLEKVYVLHTPGHSSGSLSIIVDDEIAIVGDTMYGVLSGSAYPIYADDKKLLLDSWKKLLDTNCRIFLPGHGTEKSRRLVERQYEKYRVD